MADLVRVAELERRYDGPIPLHERDAARGINTALCEARGNATMYRRFALRQIATIRQRRADGTEYPALVNDLRLYLARYRHWNHRARMMGDEG